MDGLLVIDKPVGPTSHDIVARARRALGEKRIGHTGTLDPGASGVLPLVLGKATRLARFLSAGDKVYDAVIRLGFATDTGDALGKPVGAAHQGPPPTRDVIDRALERFRGTFVQQPPAYSAKKIEGARSYQLARRASRRAAGRPTPEAAGAISSLADEPPRPAAVVVTTHDVQIVHVEADRLELRVHCSAGFYIRALAHDLGDALGTGAHLVDLRRTRSGDYLLADAVALDEIERDASMAAAAFVPLASMLPRLASVILTPDGITRARHGRDLNPGDLAAGWGGGADRAKTEPAARAAGDWVRLVAPGGELVGLAQPVPASGLLHPSVVLI